MAAYIIANALLGIVLFEYAMKETKMVRKVVEERDSLFPAWRRLDTDKISRWRMYPFAMTIMPVRILLTVFGLVLLFIVAKICYCGKGKELRTFP
jgi:hypothetical protein